MIRRIIVLTAAFFSIITLVSAQDDELPLQDIVYAEEDSLRQLLDVYLPEDLDAPAPTIVILHGGGGDKTNHALWAIHLNEAGYAVILPSYRIFPAQHTDGFCAVAWAHANAEAYQFDTDHLYVMGWSSGGGIAAEIGMIDPDIDPFEDDECPHPVPETWVAGTILLAAGSEKWPEPGWRTDMEPMIWLDGSEAPFLLIHGEDDNIIPVEDSEQMAAALEDADVSVDLLILPEAGHRFPLFGCCHIEAWQAVDGFLAEQIGLE
jgi:acetyl esterase/lipase